MVSSWNRCRSCDIRVLGNSHSRTVGQSPGAACSARRGEPAGLGFEVLSHLQPAPPDHRIVSTIGKFAVPGSQSQQLLLIADLLFSWLYSAALGWNERAVGTRLSFDCAPNLFSPKPAPQTVNIVRSRLKFLLSVCTFTKMTSARHTEAVFRCLKIRPSLRIKFKSLTLCRRSVKVCEIRVRRGRQTTATGSLGITRFLGKLGIFCVPPIMG